MHAVDLIANAIGVDLPEPQETGICCLTGTVCSTIQRRAVLGSSFVDGALLARPDSARIGVNAATALRHKWERMSSWICDGETFTRLDRIDVRNRVFTAPPNRPWVAYATTSYKKHGSLRAPVNARGRRVWLFENDLVDIDTVNEIYPRVLHARTHGVPRPVIETLDANSVVMRAYGIRAWMEFAGWANPRRLTAAYAFACYLLPSEKELRDEGKQDRPAHVPHAQQKAIVSKQGGTADMFAEQA